MKPVSALVALAVSCSLLAGSTALTISSNRNIVLNYFPTNQIDEGGAQTIKPTERVSLPALNGRRITCTGMTFDPDDNLFWICDYGRETESDPNYEPGIVGLDASFTKVERVFRLSLEPNDSLQGITYDTASHTLWFTTGNTLVNISKTGEILSRSLTKYQYNGLLYDDENDTLLALCYRRYLLTINKDNKILSQQSVNYDNQDQMCFSNNKELLISVGNDYHGDQNYIVQFNAKNNDAVRFYKAISSYAIEGMVVRGDFLYVCNDGFYHDAEIKENYIAIYSLM